MISISIKIKSEDKQIMLKLLDKIITNTTPDDIEPAAELETWQAIRDKLYLSRNDDKGMRLNLIQLLAFTNFLDRYALLGVYEAANAIGLRMEIEQKIKPKILNLNSNI